LRKLNDFHLKVNGNYISIFISAAEPDPAGVHEPLERLISLVVIALKGAEMMLQQDFFLPPRN